MAKKAEKLPKIVITHPLTARVVAEELRPHARVVLARTRPAILRELRDADGLVTLLTVKVDRELLSAAPRLRAVGNVAVGLDNIDLTACAARRIPVVNTPDVLTRATAELTLALLLAAARRIPEGERVARSGRWKGWDPDQLHGLDLKGRVAVIVGPGRIGKETGRLLRALGLKVEFIARGEPESSLRSKLRRAQILSIHAPLSPSTRHWLSAPRLALLPRDAIVLNTSRGPLVDERALVKALKARRIFAAGLDVYEDEPRIPADLRALRNTVLLPHLGSSTRETREAMARAAASGVVALLAGRRPWNLVKTLGRRAPR
ncbi:MAG TPA: NAD(P)-dependent oxidoreductase [Bdellovibrionota bacterium]|jgi:glyoxylate reductase|nr:NAD(P)-dependent oxidoreductase [Bdellovibrionota bacterium]